MNIRIIITTTLLLHLYIYGTEQSPKQVDFSRLLYTSEDILSTSAAVRESFSLRPLPEITSQLLTDRSHFTSQDTQGSTLLDALVNNTSITLESPAQKLLSFIIYNTPVTEREVMITTILENAIKKGDLTLILILLNNHPTQITPSSRRQILYTAAATGQKELIEKLLPWYEHHNQLTNQVVDTMIEKALDNDFYDLVLYLVSLYPEALKKALKSAILNDNGLLIEVLLDKNQGMGQLVTPPLFQNALCQATECNNLKAVTYLMSWGSPHHFSFFNMVQGECLIKWAFDKKHRQLLFLLCHYNPYLCETAFIYAAQYGNQEMIEAWLKEDALLQNLIINRSTIQKALINAMENKHFTIADFLMHWCNEHREIVHNNSIEEVVTNAVKVTIERTAKPHIMYALLERYPHILERYPTIVINIFQHAYSTRNLDLLRALLDENSVTGQQALSCLTSSKIEEILTRLSDDISYNLFHFVITWCEKHNRPLNKYVIEGLIPHLLLKEDESYHLSRFNSCSAIVKKALLASVRARKTEESIDKNDISTLVKHYPGSLTDTLEAAVRIKRQDIIKELLSSDIPFTAEMIKKVAAIDYGDQETTLFLLSCNPHMLSAALEGASITGNIILIQELLTQSYCNPSDIPLNVLLQTIENAFSLNAHSSFEHLIEPLFFILEHYPTKDIFEKAFTVGCKINNVSLIQYLLDEKSPTNTLITPSCVKEAFIKSISLLKYEDVNESIKKEWQDILTILFSWLSSYYRQEPDALELIAHCVFSQNMEYKTSLGQSYTTFILWILSHYPSFAGNALTEAIHVNNSLLIKELLDPNKGYREDLLPDINQIIKEEIQRTPTINESFIILLTLRDEEDNLLSLPELKTVIDECINERDTSSLIQLLERAPEFCNEVFKRLGNQIFNITINDEDNIPLIIPLISKNSFILEQFLSWRTPEGNTLPVEYIHNLFMYAVQKNNIALVKSLLKKYSFAGNEVRKMILLKSFPSLVTDAIFKYSTHSDRELTPSLLLTALQSAQKQKYFNMVALLFSQLSRFNPRPLTEKNAKDIIISYALFGHRDTLFLMLDHYPHLVNDALLSALKGKQQDILIDLCKRCEKEKPDLPKALALAAAKSGHYPVTFSLLGSYPDTLFPALEGACIGEQHTLLQTLLTQNTSTITPEMIHTLCVSAIAKHPASVNPIIDWIEQENPSLSDTLIPKIVGSAAYHGKKETTLDLIKRYPHTVSSALNGACIGGQHALVLTLLAPNSPISQHITVDMAKVAFYYALKGGHITSIDELIAWLGKHNSNLGTQAITQAIKHATQKGHSALISHLTQRYSHALSLPLDATENQLEDADTTPSSQLALEERTSAAQEEVSAAIPQPSTPRKPKHDQASPSSSKRKHG